MSDYGVTSSGFVRKRFPEQLSTLQRELKSALGSEIDLTADTVLGMLANISAERHTAIWELIEQVYGAMYPMSATGSSLDRAVSFTGVTRLEAQSSSAGVIWYGKEGTVIPQYTQVRNTVTQVLYSLESKLTLTKSASYQVQISPTSTSVNVGDVFFVQVDGKKYSFTASRSSIKEVMEGLRAQLETASQLETSLDGVLLTLTASGVTKFNLNALSSQLTINQLGVYGQVSTEEASTDMADVGDISEMVDLVTGVDKILNVVEGSAGREEESDSALYQRYHLGTYRTGAGTIESIRANLLEVKGVSSATVHQNNANSTQNGLPAHSLCCVVEGGMNSDIASTIFALAPAGITLYGNKSVSVKDSQAIAHTINFSRPVKVYIHVNVVATLLADQTESAQAGYIASIVKNILSYGNALAVGADVILQRIIGQCVAVEGVGKVSVQIARTSTMSATPSYTSDNITLAYNERAVFDSSLILVS